MVFTPWVKFKMVADMKIIILIVGILCCAHSKPYQVKKMPADNVKFTAQAYKYCGAACRRKITISKRHGPLKTKGDSRTQSGSTGR